MDSSLVIINTFIIYLDFFYHDKAFLLFSKFLYFYIEHTEKIFALLAGAVDMPTAPLFRGESPPPMSVLDMTLNHLMVRLQFWSFRECRIPNSLPFLPGLLWLVRVSSVSQIELFNHSLYLKPFNYVHTND